ncbi:MAG: hypothetical protein QGH45_02355 [Myxococcota bacterium]|nr:hypothetical protein [Myxococcota bacterium]
MATFGERLGYKVDNFLARGSKALFQALVVAFLLVFCTIAVLRFVLTGADLALGVTGLAPYLAGDPHDGYIDVVDRFLQGAWFTFLQLTDPGNMAQDNTTFRFYKLLAVTAGMSGVVIFSALIAFLTTALDQAIANLKKGHSRVLETGHAVIIGWSPRVVEILREFVEANEAAKDPVVVILSDHEKEEMDEYLRDHFTDRGNIRVVTRSGPTSSLLSLAKVRAEQADSVIVLAECGEAASREEKLVSDARVIKTVLAIVQHVGEEHEINVVAEMFDPKNRDVVKDIDPDRISVIDAQEILAKVMVQTSRTSGLSVVYSELLSFEGCEMYFHNAEWGGLAFSEVQFHFPDGVPIGIRSSQGELEMRPALDYPLADDDEVLIVADDDSTIDFRPAKVMEPDRTIPLRPGRIEPKAERQLLLGWSPKAPIIISEYADYVLDGSEVQVMLRAPSEAVIAQIAALDEDLDGLSVSHVDLDPMNVDDLASVGPFSFNTVIILPQKPEEELSAERVDSETIIVLLHLRKLQRQVEQEYGRKVGTKLITEVLDSSNQELISRAGVNDFIISNRMVSMMFAQISQEPDIQDVYDDLFQEEGSEIYVKPAWLYFETLPITCRFGDLMALVQNRDREVCIGYKHKEFEGDPAENFGVKLIPEKHTEVTLTAADGLVVVAEDDR